MNTNLRNRRTGIPQLYNIADRSPPSSPQTPHEAAPEPPPPQPPPPSHRSNVPSSAHAHGLRLSPNAPPRVPQDSAHPSPTPPPPVSICLQLNSPATAVAANVSARPETHACERKAHVSLKVPTSVQEKAEQKQSQPQACETLGALSPIGSSMDQRQGQPHQCQNTPTALSTNKRIRIHSLSLCGSTRLQLLLLLILQHDLKPTRARGALIDSIQMPTLERTKAELKQSPPQCYGTLSALSPISSSMNQHKGQPPQCQDTPTALMNTNKRIQISIPVTEEAKGSLLLATLGEVLLSI